MTVDPVCGMEIEESDAAATLKYEGTTYYFCSQSCRDQFEAEPERYTGEAGTTA